MKTDAIAAESSSPYDCSLACAQRARVNAHRMQNLNCCCCISTLLHLAVLWLHLARVAVPIALLRRTTTHYYGASTSQCKERTAFSRSASTESLISACVARWHAIRTSSAATKTTALQPRPQRCNQDPKTKALPTSVADQCEEGVCDRQDRRAVRDRRCHLAVHVATHQAGQPNGRHNGYD
jgi:hypothetical protein